MSDKLQLFDPAEYGVTTRRIRRPRAVSAGVVDVTVEWIVLRHLGHGPMAHLRHRDSTPNEYGAIRGRCGRYGLPLSNITRIVVCARCAEL